MRGVEKPSQRFEHGSDETEARTELVNYSVLKKSDTLNRSPYGRVTHPRNTKLTKGINVGTDFSPVGRDSQQGGSGVPQVLVRKP